ncbi:hypothetical protein JHV675_51220 [Mycobacterium avium subsp. hominissuis]
MRLAGGHQILHGLPGELLQKLFAGQTMKDLVAAGQAHRVPIAAVLTPSQILGSDHFQAVGAITHSRT